MATNTQKSVTLRDGTTVSFFGKGALGRILVGRDPSTNKPISWHISGRWRWDDQDHPLDITEGFTPEK